MWYIFLYYDTVRIMGCFPCTWIPSQQSLLANIYLAEIITEMELLFSNTSVAINCCNFEQSMTKIPVIANKKRIIFAATFIPVKWKVTQTEKLSQYESSESTSPRIITVQKSMIIIFFLSLLASSSPKSIPSPKRWTLMTSLTQLMSWGPGREPTLHGRPSRFS